MIVFLSSLLWAADVDISPEDAADIDAAITCSILFAGLLFLLRSNIRLCRLLFRKGFRIIPHLGLRRAFPR